MNILTSYPCGVGELVTDGRPGGVAQGPIHPCCDQRPRTNKTTLCIKGYGERDGHIAKARGFGWPEEEEKVAAHPKFQIPKGERARFPMGRCG